MKDSGRRPFGYGGRETFLALTVCEFLQPSHLDVCFVLILNSNLCALILFLCKGERIYLFKEGEPCYIHNKCKIFRSIPTTNLKSKFLRDHVI